MPVGRKGGIVLREGGKGKAAKKSSKKCFKGLFHGLAGRKEKGGYQLDKRRFLKTRLKAIEIGS